MQVRLNKTWKNKKLNFETVDIPVNWETFKLLNLCEILDNKRKALNQEERSKIKGEIPYWGANSIVDYIDKYLIDDKVVLLGEDAAPFYDKSKNVAFISEGKIWPNNHIHVLKSTKIDLYFLKSILNRINYKKIIGVANRPKLTQQMMRNIDILVPPKNQQKSIAHVLSTQESVITEMEELIELYEKRLRYTSNELLSGRLRVKEVDGETVFYKNTEWKTEKVNGKDVDIPSDWIINKIDDCIEFKKGTAPKEKEKIKTDKNKKYISMDILRGNTKEIFYTTKGIEVNIGDWGILWDGSNAGEIIKFLENGFASSTIALIKTKNDTITHNFLFFILKDIENKIRSQKQGGAIPHVDGKQLRQTFLKIPSRDEQKLIAETLRQQEELIEEQKELLELEKKRFTWLLDNLLSGKYIIEDFDENEINDEEVEASTDVKESQEEVN